MYLKSILDITAAVSAIVAAGLWFWSTKVAVKYQPHPDKDGTTQAAIIVGTDEGSDTDFIRTAYAQAMWSKRAAIAASISALCQGVALLIPSK